MTEAGKQTQDVPAAALDIGPGPHLGTTRTTRTAMIDVLIALAPVAAASLWIFQLYALKVMAACVVGCVAAEVLFQTGMRRKRLSIGDFSAVVTGLILALSLPGTCPVWVALIGSFAAIGLGKVVFGGLGTNIFNPAMVGRAFVMIAFTGFIGAAGYVGEGASVDVLTRATPMEAFKQGGVVAPLWDLVTGSTNGSLGETSAIACLLGGAYLCIRRTASWEIPLGAAIGFGAVAGIDNLTHPGAGWTILHHFAGGAFLLGALFIITDPVTSPLTPKGKFIFGAVFGVLVMGIRLFTNYPEGVMFSVLLVNAITPLIDRWTIPRPVGGPVPAPKPA